MIRNPVKRAYSGLVGMPPDPDDLPPPAPTPFNAPVYQSATEILEQMEQQKKDKRAEAARERRKLKRDQLVAIKQALKTPIAVIKARAEQERIEALDFAEPPNSDSRGASPTGAPAGNRFTTGGHSGSKMESIAAARSRAAGLGSPASDHEYPDNDRRARKPQGYGQRPGLKGDDDRRRREDDHGFLVNGFHVELNAFDYDALMKHLLWEYFEKLRQPNGEDVLVCRLCGQSWDEERDAKKHVLDVHGDESYPGHDLRFGDVVIKGIQKIKKHGYASSD